MLLADRPTHRPTTSLPVACGDWAEPQSAYRHGARKAFDLLDTLEAHHGSKLRRMAARLGLLCLQATTAAFRQEAQRGINLHPRLAVSPPNANHWAFSLLGYWRARRPREIIVRSPSRLLPDDLPRALWARFP